METLLKSHMVHLPELVENDLGMCADFGTAQNMDENAKNESKSHLMNLWLTLKGLGTWVASSRLRNSWRFKG